MKIADIINVLESVADLSLQEGYDNAGLITGDSSWECKGIICTLDATEEVIDEAISKNANLVVAHHPIIFSGLKKITGRNYVEKTVIKAIKNDIAVYAIHTNLDNVINGVSGYMAGLLKLRNCRVLEPKNNMLRKLVTFVPIDKADLVRSAVFEAGGGHIGNYSECSFNAEGYGTFKAGKGTDPFVGKQGELHREPEIRVEIIFPAFRQAAIINGLRKSHPYEEPAFDIYDLSNDFQQAGSGIIGELEKPLTSEAFLKLVKDSFHAKAVRHTRMIPGSIKKVAVCGGAGSFLISKALSAGADAFVTADMKYHDFFDANDRILIADPGHFETEQFTIRLLHGILAENFPTFAVLKTEVNTNPVQYFI